MIKESKQIDGNIFFNALVSGITNIISKHEHLNKINVFPVPDGDTGTNLLFTLRPIIKIEENHIDSHFGKTLSIIANTAIDSARGNSGTIMAQYFIGMLESSEKLENLNNENISEVFDGGFNAAASAMSEPKEGTIITVMRDVSNALSSADYQESNMLDIFTDIHNVAKASLEKTPELMKLLKDAGVVDAGAAGYVDMIKGMLHYIEHEKIMNEDIIDNIQTDTSSEVNINEEYENSKFQFCTECIVENENISRKSLKQKLSDLGDSFILAGNKRKVKIHIHTNNPSKVFSICESFGEIKNQKADDMHAQIKSSHSSKTKIAIVTDSACDISVDFHNKNIHVVPVRYSFGDKEYIDKISQTSEEFYHELKTNPIHPKTSQPPAGDFINKFEYLSTHFESAISIHIPDKLSGTMASCKNAMKKIENFKVTIMDSLCASTGLGLIVDSASELSETIQNHEELVEKIQTLIQNTKIYLGIKNIDYAIKGGRVPKLKGLIAKSLNLKPILTTDEEGKLKSAGALFGSKNFHNRLAATILKKLDQNANYKFSISHSNAEDEGHEIVEYIENNFDNTISINLVDLGSALGVHAGPGSFAIGVQKIIDD
tara:strand:+ start:2774 stop:4579 length:1806 start_codon:yes stop_codon:yes gene_type:complete